MCPTVIRTAARSADAAGSQASRMRARSRASHRALCIWTGRCSSTSSVWYAPSLTCSFSVRLRPLSRMVSPAPAAQCRSQTLQQVRSLRDYKASWSAVCLDHAALAAQQDSLHNLDPQHNEH